MVDEKPKASARAIAEKARGRASEVALLGSLTLAAWAPVWMMSDPRRVVSGYWPLQNEMDPRPLMKRFSAAGVRLALPVTPPRPSDDPLTFRSWCQTDQLKMGCFGVLEPPDDAEELVPDLLLVPLLAFDRQGARLGYGGGYYDRTLAALRSKRSIFAVGIAYAAQEMTVPRDPHDQLLDAVISERGYFPVGTSFA